MVNASIEAYHGSSERLGRLIRSNMSDLEAERETGEAESVEPSLDEQLKAHDALAAPKSAQRSEKDADEPGIDM